MKNYIVFEGCDYTGKTTLAKAFLEFFKTNVSANVICTKEPGSPLSEVCVKIRELIIHSKNIKFPETYSCLFAADTFEHLHDIVIPALNSLETVISDRCVVSDFAYRPNVDFGIRGGNFNIFKSLNPLVVWCKTTPEIIKERYSRRSDTNEFELKHVINRVEEINQNYEIFFNNNPRIDTIVFHSINDNGKLNENLFNRIIHYV